MVLSNLGEKDKRPKSTPAIVVKGLQIFDNCAEMANRIKKALESKWNAENYISAFDISQEAYILQAARETAKQCGLQESVVPSIKEIDFCDLAMDERNGLIDKRKFNIRLFAAIEEAGHENVHLWSNSSGAEIAQKLLVYRGFSKEGEVVVVVEAVSFRNAR